MNNNTQPTDTEELRARIDRLEYQVHMLNMQDFDVIRTPGRGGPGKEKGEFTSLVEGTQLAGVFPNDDYAGDQKEPWFAGCACGWVAYTSTEAEAEALVAPHLQEVHPEFVTHWPHLAGAVTA